MRRRVWLLLLCLRLAPVAQTYDADRAVAAINAAFWNPTGKYFYKLDGKTGNLDFWMTAHAWEAILEAYVRTQSPAFRQQSVDVYDGFVRSHGTDWTTNDYNDDIMWWVIACTRAYDILGEKRYLDQARKEFDWVYSTQSDTVFGGGIWWKNSEHGSKNSCIVQPAIIAAANLARQLGDPAYLAKAQALYDWQKRTLTETSGKVYDAISVNGVSKGSTTYNQGTFIGSALLLNNAADAQRMANWTRSNMCDANGILKNTAQGDFGTFNQICIRYVMQLARRPGGATYLQWMEANAASVWKNRRASDDVMGANWAAPAPGSGIECQSAFGGVALINLLATPPVSLAPASKRIAPPALGAAGFLFRGVRHAVDGARLPDTGPNPGRSR